MNRKERLKALKAKEAEIVGKLTESDYNVVLTSEDFKDNHLLPSAYLKIKDSVISTNLEQKLVIEIPAQANGNFKSDLENNIALELKAIHKQKQTIKIQAFVLLVIGVVWFIATQLLRKYEIINEIMVITTWVFVWAAVEKFFFERAALHGPRIRLLMLLDAEIKTVESKAEKH